MPLLMTSCHQIDLQKLYISCLKCAFLPPNVPSYTSIVAICQTLSVGYTWLSTFYVVQHVYKVYIHGDS